MDPDLQAMQDKRDADKAATVRVAAGDPFKAMKIAPGVRGRKGVFTVSLLPIGTIMAHKPEWKTDNHSVLVVPSPNGLSAVVTVDPAVIGSFNLTVTHPGATVEDPIITATINVPVLPDGPALEINQTA